MPSMTRPGCSVRGRSTGVGESHQALHELGRDKCLVERLRSACELRSGGSPTHQASCHRRRRRTFRPAARWTPSSALALAA